MNKVDMSAQICCNLFFLPFVCCHFSGEEKTGCTVFSIFVEALLLRHAVQIK